MNIALTTKPITLIFVKVGLIVLPREYRLRAKVYGSPENPAISQKRQNIQGDNLIKGGKLNRRASSEAALQQSKAAAPARAHHQ